MCGRGLCRLGECSESGVLVLGREERQIRWAALQDLGCSSGVVVIVSTLAAMGSMNHRRATAVIASVAKQSMVGADALHGLLRYARNDGKDTQ